MSSRRFRQWIRSTVTSMLGGGRPRRSPGRQLRHRPQLEQLEDRLVLTTPSVLSINRSVPLGPITNASSVSYAVTFNETVTNVLSSDFDVVTDGSVQAATTVGVSGSGSAYTVSVSGIHGSGDLSLDLINNGSIMGGGVPLGGSFQGQTYNILQTYPSVVSINRADANPTSADTVHFTVTFSESVTGVASNDFALALNGVTATTPVAVSGSGAIYTVTVTGIVGTGSLGLNLVDNGAIHDVAGNPLTQQNAPGAFQAQQTFATGNSPNSVAVGDLNGDGIPDLAVANGSGTVSVLLGNGNGTFQARHAFAAGRYPISVAVGDLNGDGKPDLVVTNEGYLGSGATVSVLLGNGNGTFQAQQNFAAGYSPHSVAVADVNGDGKPDLIVANTGSFFEPGVVNVLLGNGNGTFQAQQAVASFRASSESVAVDDVNGDGKPDIAVANQGYPVSVLLANGNGTFQAQQTFAAGSDPISVAVEDLNGDGKPDLVVASATSASVSVLLSNSNGTFQAQQTFATGSDPIFVAVVDVNGDGKPDLAVVNNSSNTVSVLLGNGNGTFQAQQTLATGSTPNSVVVGDVNGDGRPDLALANSASNTVSVLLNAANGNFTGPVYTLQNSGAATHFIIAGLPSSVTAGAGFTFTVTAEDSNNNTATGYTGTVAFTSSDTRAGVVLPASSALTSGTGIFSAALITAGSQTLIATDTLVNTVSGSNGPITVNPQLATHFVVSGITSSITAGAPIGFLVTAQDQFNNTATGYTGAIGFTSSDGAASLPAGGVLASGIGTFSATLYTAGNQTITAQGSGNLIGDNSFETPTLAAGSFQYNPGGTPWQFSGQSGVSANGSGFTSGNPNAPDGNQVGFLQASGTISQSLSIPAATYSLTFLAAQRGNASAGGQQIQIDLDGVPIGQLTPPSTSYLSYQAPSFTVATTGMHTLTFLGLNPHGGDNTAFLDLVQFGPAVASGNSNTITVSAAAASHFTVLAPSNVAAGGSFRFLVTAEDQFNNVATSYIGTVHFTSNDSAAVLPADSTLINGTGAFAGTLKTAGDRTITATDTVTSAISGSSNPVLVGAVKQAAGNVSGVIGVDTEWYDTSGTYVINGNLTIATGVTLTVDPGVSVQIGPAPTDGTLTIADNGTLIFGASDNVTLDANVPAPYPTNYSTVRIEVGSGGLMTASGANFNATTAYNYNSGYSTQIQVDSGGHLQASNSSFSVGQVNLSSGAILNAGDFVGNAFYGPLYIPAIDVQYLSGTANNNLRFQAIYIQPNDTLLSGQTLTLSAIGTQTTTSLSYIFPGNFTVDQGASVTVGPNVPLQIGGDFTINPGATLAIGSNVNMTIGPAPTDGTLTIADNGTLIFGASDNVTLDANVPAPYPTNYSTVKIEVGSGGLMTASSANFNATTAYNYNSGYSTQIQVDSGGHLQASNSSFSVGQVNLTAGSTDTIQFSTFATQLAINSAASISISSDDFSSTSATVVASGAASDMINLNNNFWGTTNPTLIAAKITDHHVNSALPTVEFNSIVSNPQQAVTFAIAGTPSTATSGTIFTFTVAALDLYCQIAASYNGTVVFTSSDTAALLPAPSMLTNGLGEFSATLYSAGDQTIVGTDSAVSSITGSCGSIAVEAIVPSDGPGATLFDTGYGANGQLVPSAQNGFNGTTGNTNDAHYTLVAVTSNPFTYSTPNFTGTSVNEGTATNTFANPLAPNWILNTATSDWITPAAVASNPISAPAGTYVYQTTFSLPTLSAGTTVTLSGMWSMDDVGVGITLNGVPITTAETPATGSGFEQFYPFNTSSATATFQQGVNTLDFYVYNVTSNTGLQVDDLTVTAGPLATATHFVISTPTGITAGNGFSFTVTALDAFGNSATNYNGTVEFSTSDSVGTIPANVTVTGGVGTFSATLTTAGSQTILATDIANGSITGASNSIAVSPAALTKFALRAPATTTAGNVITLQVTAQDQFNNTVTSFASPVVFSTNDTQVTAGNGLPVASTLINGSGSYGVILRTAGRKMVINVGDSTDPSINDGDDVNVDPGLPVQIVVSDPTNTAGLPTTLTVAVEDQFNNVVTSFNGTVAFTSSDQGPATVVPAPTTLTSGVGVFSVTLTTAGNQTVTVTDTTNSNLKGATTVGLAAAPATHITVVAPSSTTAGNGVTFTLTALDQFNNTASGYSGTVHITTSDPQAVLASSIVTLTSGAGLFAVILKTAGNQKLTAIDLATNSISGSSSPIAVAAAPANHFVVTTAIPSFASVTAAYPTVPMAATSFASTGAPVVFTVTAEDPFGNVNANYGGTVAFGSSDTAAILPAHNTLSGGVGTFSATLQTAGNDFITATDATTPSITGASSAIVTRGLVVTSFAPTPSGFTIAFDKPFNPSTVLMYTAGSTPDDIILATTNSQVSVRGSVIINATDTGFTFVKTDSISALGAFNPASGLLAAGNYTLTLRSLSGGNGFADTLGTPLDGTDTDSPGANYRITFSVSAPPVAVGIPDFARGPSNTDALFLPSTLTNGSTFNLSFTNPAANPSTGTAIITFSTTVATLASNIQTALTNGGLAKQVGVNTSAGNTPNSVVVVTNDVTSGANVLVTFQSALATATNQLLSSTTAGVTITPATINVANNIPGDGIPIGLSSGLNVTSGSFTLQYNPNLLAITGVVSKVAGASFTLVSNNTLTGTVVLSLSSPSSLSSTATPLTMGSLLASVPFSAAASYGAMQLLHFSNEQLSGTAGPIAVTDQDSVEAAAYFGDVTDAGGPLSLNDSSAVSAVAGAVPNTGAQTIPGFGAFPDLDPAVIGDVSLQGNVNSTDAGALLQEVGGSDRPTIPYAPIGLPVTPASPGVTLAVASPKLTADGGTPGGSSPTSVASVGHGILVIEPSVVVDQVFANSSGSVPDLALVQSPSGEAQQPWLSNVKWASLDTLAGGGLVGSTADVRSQEQGDPDAVEALFAREATKGGLFRF
jgi:hypothetical protein